VERVDRRAGKDGICGEGKSVLKAAERAEILVFLTLGELAGKGDEDSAAYGWSNVGGREKTVFKPSWTTSTILARR